MLEFRRTNIFVRQKMDELLGKNDGYNAINQASKNHSMTTTISTTTNESLNISGKWIDFQINQIKSHVESTIDNSWNTMYINSSFDCLQGLLYNR